MFTRERLSRWTASLRKNAGRQAVGQLLHEDGKQCCLGHLCEVEGLEVDPKTKTRYLFPQAGKVYSEAGFLIMALKSEFGSGAGYFSALRMPPLVCQGRAFVSAAEANDNFVSWAVIADHFDAFYPCSDELPKSPDQDTQNTHGNQE